jgi:hypothetical protein
MRLIPVASIEAANEAEEEARVALIPLECNHPNLLHQPQIYRGVPLLDLLPAIWTTDYTKRDN